MDWAINESKIEFKHFESIFITYLESINYRPKVSIFSYSIRQFYENKPIELAHFAIKLLTNRKGKYRYGGFQFFEFFAENGFNFPTKEAILGLTGDVKICLLISLFTPQSLHFEYFFKIILPLIQDPSINVHDLVNKIIAKNYIFYPQIIKVIETAEFVIKEKENIINQLNDFDSKYHSLQLEKFKLNELNPRVAQRGLYEIFSTYQKEKMNNDWVEQEKEMWFFQLGAGKLMLLKGGGFKTEDNKVINKLHTISSQVNLPVNALLLTEKDDLNNRIFFTDDWDYINDIEKWLTRFL